MTDRPIDLDAIKREHDADASCFPELDRAEYMALSASIHRRRGQLIAEVERLRARVADLERDAARYRWLRDDAGNAIMRKLMGEARPTKWDEFVDEAMSEGER